MAPTLVREPFHRDGWVYEEKVDGWRSIAYKNGDRVRLVSPHGRDHTRRFTDLAAAISKLSDHTLVLDGEVAIYDQQLRSRLDWLRELDPDNYAALTEPDDEILRAMRALRWLGCALLPLVFSGCVVAEGGGPIYVPGPPVAGPPPNIPKGHYPPPASCRIWFPDRPPGQQPPPGPCEQLQYQVPPGAYLIRG